MAREQSVLDRVRDKIEQAGGSVIKTHGSSLRMGEPDLLGVWPYLTQGHKLGIMIAIETKQPGKKPKPLQYARIAFWNSKGAIAIWTSDPNEIIEIIRNELAARLQDETTLDQYGRPRLPERRSLHGKYRKLSNDAGDSPNPFLGVSPQQ